MEDYIKQYSGEVEKRLNVIRKIILENATDATEKISWGMPTYMLNGNLIHFAAHKNHIGIYPSPSGIERFSKELKGYKTSKGAIQFLNNEELPIELIRKIVIFRVKENSEKN